MLFFVRKHKIDDALVEEPNPLWIPEEIKDETRLGQYILIHDQYPAAYVTALDVEGARQWAVENLP